MEAHKYLFAHLIGFFVFLFINLFSIKKKKLTAKTNSTLMKDLIGKKQSLNDKTQIYRTEMKNDET